MARSHLTLAALAASAVPDLDAVAAAPFGSGSGDVESAIITARDGSHWLVKVPTTPHAEAEQSADLVALRALSQGVRARLPFAVAQFAGQVPVSGTRAVVYSFVYGAKVPLASWDATLAASVGAAIGSIHALPSSVVSDAGLPSMTAAECQRACVSIADRAAATGLLPAALVGRWERGLEDARLWQFQPSVIHGSLASESILSAGGTVTGILGWHDLRVGDPAKDLQFVLGTRSESLVESALGAYQRARGAHDRELLQRARLYSELELAQWLLHGTEIHSTEIVDDAVELLTGLADSLRTDVVNPLGAQTMPTMAVDEVEALLERTRRAV
ncbi:macrolide phosphotransferase [Microbacteriaceae bacterium SG_E_30_P1]|uniref:Macrolide phosphotransferase n=1 Tax=Antiquaquibacter oligotrophicus TaxID=2880260 RepID=A0ABT6KL29_9MICO|nr:phosphotransferase [Antiquaquibacter oligotrophicus]MDH6180430.1 macrolide phosphotransferase [Antiquaquibacter oligotrophicus]UDF13832.1 phosphotransferase [Antiquaquibacter oligotrophicus]